MSLRQRDITPEIMDEPDLDPALHAAALRGLHRLNRISSAGRHVISALRKIAKTEPSQQPLRIIDIATGSGDIFIAIHKWAANRNIPVALSGCDISPTAVQLAQRNAERSAGNDIRFFTHDALAHELPERYDIALLCLFMHHLQEAQCRALLARVRQSCTHVIISDLVRSRLTLVLVNLAACLVTRSHVVHHDADRSVRAAFARGELEALLEQAGFEVVCSRYRFPARWLVIGRAA